MRKSPAPRKTTRQHGNRGVVTHPNADGAGTTVANDSISPDAGDAVPAAIDTSITLIELDPEVSGGFIDDRFDIMIRGRVRSDVRIIQIRLVIDDWINSRTSHAVPGPPTNGVLPDGGAGWHYAFQFNLPRPGTSGTLGCKFKIVARTDQGNEQAADFEVAAVQEGSNLLSVIDGPTLAYTAFDELRPHAIMYVEIASIDPAGVLTVNGWAVASVGILAIEIYLDGVRIDDPRIGQPRGDVGFVYPAYPNAGSSGFDLIAHLDTASRDARSVRARLVCASGLAHEETIPVHHLTEPIIRSVASSDAAHASAAAPDSTEIEMYCDEAQLSGDGRLFVNGWAVCASGISRIRVLLDDHDVGLATFGHERLDVGRAFLDIPMAHLSGFQFQCHVGHPDENPHTVTVIVCNSRGDETQKQVPIIAMQPVAGGLRHQDDAPDPEWMPEQSHEFRLQLDSPVLANGRTVEPVSGRLTIEGWLLTRTGIASFDVWLDDQRLGDAHSGLARQDVALAFPDWPNALRSGFAFHCAPRSLRDGEHTIRLAIRAKNGVEVTRMFRVTIKKSDEHGDSIAIRRRVPRVEADMLSSFLAEMNCEPRFHFVVRHEPTTGRDAWRVTLTALRLQAYRAWTLTILAPDKDSASHVAGMLRDLEPGLMDRLVILDVMDAAWDAPLAQASDGRTMLHGLLSPGDELGADALLELAVACGCHPGKDLFYGDEVRASPVSGQPEPFFKPDFSPDLLLSTNYVGRLWVATSVLLAQTGATSASLTADGEYDLVLRCAEHAAGVHHVSKLLCNRAAVGFDAPGLEQRALAGALDRRGDAATVLATPIPGTWRVRRALRPVGKVSIIIPTCAANRYIETCIKTLRALTSYPDYEIICVDNIPASDSLSKNWVRQHADKVVDMPGPFNWSVFNNQAAEAACGDYLLFLNDDIEIIQDDWLDALVEHAQRPEVGIVGPQLRYRDGKVQHAGMFLSNNGIGRHAFRFAAHDDPCYFGLALTQRNVMAVTGACMMVRRETFRSLGGFDGAHEIINNDLDFCLRAHRAGLLTVYTPYATLIHYELASRARMKDAFDVARFNRQWKTTFAAGDPYFNPRLARQTEDYQPDDEPVQLAVAGTPIFHVHEIERILVLKLDHIGDFVTALPPIRRLRAIFPHARITVLAGPASRDFIALEPSIDEFIPFSFFHTRSQLGERTLAAEDYGVLAEELMQCRFDLAVDLRKHPSTRDVLRHTGARFLAGFDYLGQFPFLDIALDWDGDRHLQRKRSHVVDDLVALVNAIGQATGDDRLLMHPNQSVMSLADLPPAVKALFDRPVVAIHPGAGNITKQWPEAHFAALIDLLIERNAVNVLLVGGPDDVGIADGLLRTVLRRQNVASMAGKTTLAELSRLFKICSLYIGNDSGPKHIAAGVGIPTIGIHSGVVDPLEWGPIGPKAVALRRNMTCSPCYLANAEDCPRSLACLRLLEPGVVYETADMMLKGTRPVKLPDLDVKALALREASRRRAQPRRRQTVIDAA